MIPTECANGIRYPGTCQIRCNSGFLNTGPSTVTCQADGSFSVAKLSDLGCRKGSFIFWKITYYKLLVYIII